MNRVQLYKRLLKVAEDNYIEEPMLVGGLPRDLYRKKINQTTDDYFKKDIDVTTNDADSLRLSIAFAVDTNFSFNIFNDSHISVYADEYTFDFSSHFISKRAVRYIKSELNITDEKLFEVYSRDFTINTLHKGLLDSELSDLTDSGLQDVESKKIRTVVPPQITLMDDRRRAWRALGFAARFGYEIDGSLVDYIRKHNNFFAVSNDEKKKKISEQFISRIISESLEHDKDLTIGYLKDLNLLSLVPLVGDFKEEIMGSNLVPMYLDEANRF